MNTPQGAGDITVNNTVLAFIGLSIQLARKT